MQLIDEKTYIDESLVTCAEYQLFIDEMCEQGKYYQPDHWNSYRFSEGKARQPILGVRPSDAKELCEWLTQRVDREWSYRLPIQEEVMNFPLKYSPQGEFGYWIMNMKNEYGFAWIGPHPQDARQISYSRVEGYALRSAHSLHDRYLSSAEYDNIRRKLERDIERAYKRAYTRALNLDFHDASTRALDLNNVIIRTDNRYKEDYLDLHFNFKSHIQSTLDHAVYAHDDQSFDMFLDIFTLGERIMELAFPFEGIRLVKERIR
ncbi:MAG TPA: hypothetical protein VK206_28380 [Anaerolineales bacterium]|nr:hypothetical protein [Anaerolineales bacterium]